MNQGYGFGISNYSLPRLTDAGAQPVGDEPRGVPRLFLPLTKLRSRRGPHSGPRVKRYRTPARGIFPDEKEGVTQEELKLGFALVSTGAVDETWKLKSFSP
jgi:hypothetical protein